MPSIPFSAFAKGLSQGRPCAETLRAPEREQKPQQTPPLTGVGEESYIPAARAVRAGKRESRAYRSPRRFLTRWGCSKQKASQREAQEGVVSELSLGKWGRGSRQKLPLGRPGFGKGLSHLRRPLLPGHISASP